MRKSKGGVPWIEYLIIFILISVAVFFRISILTPPMRFDIFRLIIEKIHENPNHGVPAQPE